MDSWREEKTRYDISVDQPIAVRLFKDDVVLIQLRVLVLAVLGQLLQAELVDQPARSEG